MVIIASSSTISVPVIRTPPATGKLPSLTLPTVKQVPVVPVGLEVVALKGNEGKEMKTINRITFDPEVMGGKPCIRGLRVTVGTLVGLIAAGRTRDEILNLYPYLEAEDVAQALAYAAWRVEEIDVPLVFA